MPDCGVMLSNDHVKATADDVCVAVGSMVIRLVCPICQQSIPYSEVQDHLSFCLQEVVGLATNGTSLSKDT